MNKLEFFPEGLLSMRRYTLTRDGAEIGQIDCGGTGGAASISVDGATYRPVTDSVLRGRFHLEKNGTLVASAQSAGFWRRRFMIQIGAKSCTLRPSWSGRSFVLLQNDTEAGRIGATGFFSRKCEAELPDDLPLEVQAFLIWLVISTWRRMVVAGVMAGTVAGR
jgi:hypothetical protein